MIRAGSHGLLLVSGAAMGRCIDWTLTIERDIRARTPAYRWGEQSVPLRRSARGETMLLYDPDDGATEAMLSSFRLNEPPPIELQLRTDKASDSGYDVQAHVTSVGTVVAAKDAHRVRLSFAVSGPVVPV